MSQVQGSTNPGSLALSDLRGYEARERTPVCAAYERWRVCGVPPPSAGGIAIAQILGTLQALEARDSRWSLAKLPPIPAPTLAGAEPRPEAVHLIAEADRLAYADRGFYVADPDFVPVDVAGLTDRDYIAQRARLISERSLGKAPPGVLRGATLSLAPDRSPMRTSTSQVVAVDDSGGAVSMTTTVEHAFGSHLMVEGFVLNNQLTDFSFIPREGGGKLVANRVEAGKRLPWRWLDVRRTALTLMSSWRAYSANWTLPARANRRRGDELSCPPDPRGRGRFRATLNKVY